VQWSEEGGAATTDTGVEAQPCVIATPKKKIVIRIKTSKLLNLIAFSSGVALDLRRMPRF